MLSILPTHSGVTEWNQRKKPEHPSAHLYTNEEHDDLSGLIAPGLSDN